MIKENNDLSEWVESQRKSHNGLLCELKPILKADPIDFYRNKCEFTIGKKFISYIHLEVFFNYSSFLITGKSETSADVMIGFRLSSYAAGCTAVGPIEGLKHIPQRMVDAVKVR